MATMGNGCGPFPDLLKPAAATLEFSGCLLSLALDRLLSFLGTAFFLFGTGLDFINRNLAYNQASE
jgi:hypothetical protein